MPIYAFLFVLFAVVAIASYFYLMWAKARDDAKKDPTSRALASDDRS